MISLTIFSLCLQITKVIAKSEITKNGKEIFEVLKLKNIIKGRVNAALILASDTILNNAIITINIPSVASPTCHEMPRNTPNPVATALPPFQFSQTGQMWPIKVDSPMATCHESFIRKCFAKTIDKIPLKTSSRKTVMAARFPICLKTFVAPVDQNLMNEYQFLLQFFQLNNH